jgi:hypothetical protein
MSRNNTRNLTAAAAIAAASITISHLASSARAVPINGQYIEDPRCDVLPNQQLTHELGRVPFFPINEAIDVNVTPATFTVCVPDDGIANDWIVQMTNISGVAWKNLFFVANNGMTIGNSDGSMIDVAGAPNIKTDSFRIDGTVTVGVNNNLLGESFGPPDEIFSPGEIWRFNVSNFMSPAGGVLPPLFTTPGIFAGSAPVTQVDTASILAIPVPEPTFVGLAGCVGGALLLRRPRRA